jgi:hypothetical protein
LEFKHLRVVRRNYQDFLQTDRSLDAFAVNPGCPILQDVGNEVSDHVGLLARRALVANVLYGKVTKPSAAEPTLRLYRLVL